MKKPLFSLLLAIIVAVTTCALASCSRKRIVPGASPSSKPVEHTVVPEDNGAEATATAPENLETEAPKETANSEVHGEQTTAPKSSATKPPKESDTTDGGAANDAGEQKVNADSSSSDNTVKTPDENGGQGKPADEGDAIGVIVGEYSALLSQGLGTLYECHIPYVYAELAADYQTGNRKSALHTLIIESGGYNTSEKLPDSAQTVDAAWVLRKNPEVLVKFVNPSILGFGVTSTQAAAVQYAELAARTGWSGLSAILNRKVIFLSSTLLDTPQGQLVAKLYIARTMHPELFSDLDVDAVCQQALGPNGIHCFTT